MKHLPERSMCPDAAGAPPRPGFLLGRDEVHLWWRRIGDGEPTAESRGWLSDPERRRCERFRSERDARAFAERRSFLRALLARYLGCSPAAIAFEADALGKPALAAPARSGLSFSLSRSMEWVLVGVARERELGVDVERLDPRLAGPEELSRLARSVLSPPELEAFDRLPAPERPAAFFRAWTRKEAVLKALGLGLSREPASLEVGLEPLAPGEALLLDGKTFPRERGGLLLDLEAPRGFCAALAGVGCDWRPVVVVAPRPRGRFVPPAVETQGPFVFTAVLSSPGSSVRSTRPGIPPTTE